MKKTILTIVIAAAALTAGARQYDITEFGAVNDTTRLSTAALQKAPAMTAEAARCLSPQAPTRPAASYCGAT